MAFSATPRETSLARACRATVRVGGGSGAVIQPQEARVILTAEHVVRGQNRVEVRWPGGAANMNVLQTDAANDIAIVDCPDGLTVSPLRVMRDDEQIAVGDPLTVVGFPSGWTTNNPVVSPSVVGGVGDEIWLNANASWGNSGGPAVHLDEEEPCIAGVLLGRGGAVERALEQTIGNLNHAVSQLNQLSQSGGQVQLLGINFAEFARFTASALHSSCQFIGTHFRSGFVVVAGHGTVNRFLHP